MEEKNSSKQVEMSLHTNAKGNTATSEEKQQRYTYEELNKICGELFQRCQLLQKQVRQLEMSNMFERLNYLFKVVENKDSFKESFVQSCTEEIETAITIPEEKTETQEEA